MKSFSPPLPSPVTHNDIVHHFIHHKRKNLHDEFAWFANQPSFARALDEATHARNSRGKRLSHQCLLPRHVIPTSFPLLQAQSRQLERSGSFDELFDHVELTLSGIKAELCSSRTKPAQSIRYIRFPALQKSQNTLSMREPYQDGGALLIHHTSSVQTRHPALHSCGDAARS